MEVALFQECKIIDEIPQLMNPSWQALLLYKVL